jgi:uncharacterized protein (TIGR02266 family)
MADARKDKRTLLSLKIRYKSATLEDFIERYSIDISRGGVFIKAKKPLAVGTLLKFEFMLQDQSTLIHGVGRVVWRREQSEADSHNPSGMGIKFIKMDPESRSVVQRISELRGEPGVFEHGKEGVQPSSLIPSARGTQAEADRTKVRHVSEFLASALDEGDAGDQVRREARDGAERARRVSDQIGGHRPAARGAFSGGDQRTAQGRGSEAPARGAMSAFGASGLGSTASLRRSSAAPAMEELDAEEDFLDNETTKIHDGYESDYPHAAQTVVSHDAASHFAAEKRPTPVVPTDKRESRVSDLFGPDSFGPAVDSIDPRLLDPDTATVPPPGSVPEAPGIPEEAFKLPQSSEPVWTMRPADPEPETRGWMATLLLALLVCAAGVATWQLGFADGLIDRATAMLGQSDTPPQAPPKVAPTLAPAEAVAVAEEATAQPEAETAPTDQPDAVADAEPAPAAAPEAGSTVKFEVVSQPAGAYVSVNGKGVGRAPVELEYEVGTKLSIFSKARGYLPRRQRITVEADQPKIEFVLSTLPFVVDIITNPLGASASSVGGGQVSTPGSLKFRSMPATRKIVISKDGYKTVTKSVSRTNFVEEPRRMAATVSVSLEPDGSSKEEAGAEPTPSEPAAEPEPEAKAAPPAPEPPAPADEAPAASESSSADAP